MKIHHLNCGTIRVFGGNALIGDAKPFERAVGVMHCLLLENDDGLFLVDTGFGLGDCHHPTRFMRWMIGLSGFSRDPAETAFQQISALGMDPKDVRNIAITHFHYDHVGGLPDFPKAKVHIYEEEMNAILHPRDMNERFPYRREHWSHSPNWQVHRLGYEPWFGMPATPQLDLGGVRMCFVPLVGHTRGHSAVALQIEDTWLLHCGDAYTFHGHVHPTRPRQPAYAFLSKPLVMLSRPFRQIGKHNASLRRLLREHGEEVVLTCSHDVQEFEKFSALNIKALAKRQVESWEKDLS